jgi:YidC/Oxa1 family membrane protein insertase
MNDIRRTILWVIFGFSLVLLWDQWQLHNGRQATFFPTPAKPAATAPAATGIAASGAASTPAPSSLPATAAAPAGSAQVPADSARVPVARERVTVTTDVLRLTFDSEGGSLVRSEFLKHVDMDDKNRPFVLLEESPDRVYLAQTGLIGGNFPTHKTAMTFSGDKTLPDGANQLVARFESADIGGVKLVKTYTVKRGDYAIAVRHEVINTGTAAVTPQLYLQLRARRQQAAGRVGVLLHLHRSGGLSPTPRSTRRSNSATSKKAKPGGRQEFASNGYVAMVQHYFASAWLLADGVVRENFVRKVDTNLYAVGMITPVKDIAPGSSCRWRRASLSVRRKKRCWNPWHRAWNWSRTTAG